MAAETAVLAVIAAGTAGLVYLGLRGFFRDRRERRHSFIRRYVFPPTVARRLQVRYPSLTSAQCDLALHALRDFFRIALFAQPRLVAMPSQAVDVLWHEFILSTHAYHDFCRRAFGRYFHHVPAETMARHAGASQSLKRCWRLACVFEGITPKAPERLPRLFRVDAELGIDDGYRYVLDCSQSPQRDRRAHCGSHVGCTSCAGGGSGAADGVGDGVDLAGCGGGSGCGGGGD